MNCLHETIIETALYIGYCMGETKEMFTADSRVAIEAIQKESKVFEDSLETKNPTLIIWRR